MRRVTAVMSIASVPVLDTVAEEMAVVAGCEPADFYRPSVVQRPEALLCQAVLQSALKSLRDPESPCDYCAACLWVQGEDADLPFELCCAVLRLHPVVLRAAVQVLYPCCGACALQPEAAVV